MKLSDGVIYLRLTDFSWGASWGTSCVGFLGGSLRLSGGLPGELPGGLHGELPRGL